eukprot:gnl/TRDRNA2_/TRDRNA2_207182_c0_seq1.p1 gnl/TRDRNA2_/TRDRNA2_207182_c0~~gnl/TRDRNA2_/TRDRNA2_207182_c0_seq1.p1  ORF type:complete len:136 (-),score=8.66 gnl/TRDRNA2_/TRDRNA2_207182_c0_seq1:156-563(-)
MTCADAMPQRAPEKVTKLACATTGDYDEVDDVDTYRFANLRDVGGSEHVEDSHCPERSSRSALPNKPHSSQNRLRLVMRVRSFSTRAYCRAYYRTLGFRIFTMTTPLSLDSGLETLYGVESLPRKVSAKFLVQFA